MVAAMAEERKGGEATEPPSEKKLRDARRKGDVPRSRDVVSTAVFAAAAAVVAWGWPHLVGQLRSAMAMHLHAATRLDASPTLMLDQGLTTLGLVCMPVLGAAFVVAMVAGYAQVGAVLSLQPVTPSLRRLDPIHNAKNIFGKAALFELLKSVVKVVGIGYVAFVAFWHHLPRIVATVGRPPETSLLVVADAAGAIALRVLVLAALLAAADLLYQRWRYRKRQMMTKVELRREQKESEGDPQRKAERRRLHQEILEHQMLESVALADCVIINPDHVAVALRYDDQSMGAPKVVARGRRLIAAKIRQIARQRGVPIVRNVPLARALVDLELDDEIPAELFEAVAEVLRFVYRISGRQR